MTVDELYNLRRKVYKHKRDKARQSEALSRLLSELNIDPRGVRDRKEAMGRASVAIQLRHFAEKGIRAGSRVVYSNEGTFFVSKIIEKTGTASLTGKRGHFPPSGLELADG